MKVRTSLVRVIGLLAAFCFVGASAVDAARRDCTAFVCTHDASVSCTSDAECDNLSAGSTCLAGSAHGAAGLASCGSATFSLSGNSRAQIGNGLPIPIGFTAAPNGKILVKPGATVAQTGVDPKTMMFASPQSGFDGPPFNLPVFLFNPNVFQVNTNVSLASAVTPIAPGPGTGFKAGGRTGASVVTWCPGLTATVLAGSNPGCSGPGSVTAAAVKGLIRYTKTKNQFGGVAQAAVGGTADVGIRGGLAGAPCNAFGCGPTPTTPACTNRPATVVDADCVVVMAVADPFPTGAVGAPFGFTNKTLGIAPTSGRFYASITGGGRITYAGPQAGNGVKNPVHEYGAPFTTGMLTVSQTANEGPVDEIFMFSGSDNRVNGVGNISLVAGSVSDRALTGLNANRSWINWTVQGQPQLPTVGTHGLVALTGLMALAGGYALRRRARRSA